MKNIIVILICYCSLYANSQDIQIYKTFDFLQFEPLDTIIYSYSRNTILLNVEIDSVEIERDTINNKVSKIRLLKHDWLKDYYIIPTYDKDFIILNFISVRDFESEETPPPQPCNFPVIYILPSTYIYCNVAEECDRWKNNKVYQIHKLDAQLRSINTFIFSKINHQLILFTEIEERKNNESSISLFLPIKNLKINTIDVTNYSKGKFPQFDFCEEVYFQTSEGNYSSLLHHIGFTNRSSSYLIGWWEEQ